MSKVTTEHSATDLADMIAAELRLLDPRIRASPRQVLALRRGVPEPAAERASASIPQPQTAASLSRRNCCTCWLGKAAIAVSNCRSSFCTRVEWRPRAASTAPEAAASIPS